MAEKEQHIQRFTGKRTVGQNLGLACLIGLVSMQVFFIWPTQYFAATFHYDTGLGEPIWRGVKWAFYAPWDWIDWGWRLGDLPETQKASGTMITLGYAGIFMGFVVAALAAFFLNKPHKGMENLHGSAHYASFQEINATGFISVAGKGYWLPVIALGVLTAAGGMFFASRWIGYAWLAHLLAVVR